MTQRNPAIDAGLSGLNFRLAANQIFEALLTLNAGATRPSYATAHMPWLDTSATPWTLYIFDGTEDIAIGTINATTNLFQAANALAASGAAMTGLLDLAKGAAIASASTTDIGAATANLVHITGTSTITSLGTAAQAGAERTVIFDGALTLTHSANLMLPGAANITTVAGDVALFVADTTTKWVCRGYVKAGSVQAFLNVAQAWTQPQALQNETSLTNQSGTMALAELANYQKINITTSANIILANPTITEAMVGRNIRIRIAAGHQIDGLGSYWKRAGDTGIPPVPATGFLRIDGDIVATDRIEFTALEVEA